MRGSTAMSPSPEGRVLVVDDEDHVRKPLMRSLALRGYIVDGAAFGDQALEILERTPYDVMVLDLRMPGMDGLEVMRRACHMYPELHIIVLTGHATLESAISAVKSRAVDYLLKPASVHEVASTISTALRQRKAQRHRQRLLETVSQLLEDARGLDTWGGMVPALAQGRFLRVGRVTLDRQEYLVIIARDDDAGDSKAQLTPCEVRLLACMMQRPGSVLSWRELAQAVLGYEVGQRDAKGIVRPHICRLRKKLEPDPDHPRLIRTVRGEGYLFAP